MRYLWILIVGAICLLPSITLAEIPHAMSYQGILKDSTGAPVDDDVYAIKFAIYSDSISGPALWETSGFVPIQTRDGLFDHVMGTTNPIPDSIAEFENLWVGVTVNLEPEMAPRTRLTSVPFAFAAQYADTATVSRDKTVDAGELTTGALDTARFSAYGDLLSENRVGPAPDQVAAGEHTHLLWEMHRGIMSVEDTATTVAFVPSGNEILVRNIQIPSGVINDFFRYYISMRVDQLDTPAYIIVKIEGQYVWACYSESIAQVIASGCQRFLGTSWVAFGGQGSNIDIHPEDGLIIEVYVSYGGTGVCRVTTGRFLVEYDVD
jgi:hypothetical protein